MSPTSNCIDVGCFKGEILDLMLSAAPKGHHFGVEPTPDQFDYLQSKYAHQTHCTLFNVAASDVLGESSFNYVSSNPSYSGLKKRDYDRPNETDTTITVETNRLDDLIPKEMPIQLIKIDVEGAEFLVLKGAQKIIQRCQPIVVFEHGLGASDHYDTTPDDIYTFFSNNSMKISTLGNFLKHKACLSQPAFSEQYYQKINYYFVAHP